MISISVQAHRPTSPARFKLRPSSGAITACSVCVAIAYREFERGGYKRGLLSCSQPRETDGYTQGRGCRSAQRSLASDARGTRRTQPLSVVRARQKPRAYGDDARSATAAVLILFYWRHVDVRVQIPDGRLLGRSPQGGLRPAGPGRICSQTQEQRRGRHFRNE